MWRDLTVRKYFNYQEMKAPAQASDVLPKMTKERQKELYKSVR